MLQIDNNAFALWDVNGANLQWFHGIPPIVSSIFLLVILHRLSDKVFNQAQRNWNYAFKNINRRI